MVVQNISEDLKITRLVDTGILSRLLQVGEDTPLTCLVTYERLTVSILAWKSVSEPGSLRRQSSRPRTPALT